MITNVCKDPELLDIFDFFGAIRAHPKDRLKDAKWHMDNKTFHRLYFEVAAPAPAPGAEKFLIGFPVVIDPNIAVPCLVSEPE